MKQFLSVGDGEHLFFTVSLREEGEDGGPSLSIFVRVPAPSPDNENPHQRQSPRFEEVHRVDIFNTRPHTHKFHGLDEDRLDYTGVSATAQFVDCLEKLSRIDLILAEVGCSGLIDKVRQSDVDKAIPKLRIWLQEAAM